MVTFSPRECENTTLSIRRQSPVGADRSEAAAAGESAAVQDKGSHPTSATKGVHKVGVSDSCTFEAVLTPNNARSDQYDTSSETFRGATSFRTIKTTILISVVVKGEEIKKLVMDSLVSICYSILYIDQTENQTEGESNSRQRTIDFSSCLVGNTYFRDIQLWNRSECSLVYQIRPQNSNVSAFTFGDAETGDKLPFLRLDHYHARLVGWHYRRLVSDRKSYGGTRSDN